MAASPTSTALVKTEPGILATIPAVGHGQVVTTLPPGPNAVAPAPLQLAQLPAVRPAQLPPALLASLGLPPLPLPAPVIKQEQVGGGGPTPMDVSPLGPRPPVAAPAPAPAIPWPGPSMRLVPPPPPGGDGHPLNNVLRNYDRAVLRGLQLQSRLTEVEAEIKNLLDLLGPLGPGGQLSREQAAQALRALVDERQRLQRQVATFQVPAFRRETLRVLYDPDLDPQDACAVYSAMEHKAWELADAWAATPQYGSLVPAPGAFWQVYSSGDAQVQAYAQQLDHMLPFMVQHIRAAGAATYLPQLGADVLKQHPEWQAADPCLQQSERIGYYW